jgi:hypothetical protein
MIPDDKPIPSRLRFLVEEMLACQDLVSSRLGQNDIVDFSRVIYCIENIVADIRVEEWSAGADELEKEEEQ